MKFVIRPCLHAFNDHSERRIDPFRLAAVMEGMNLVPHPDPRGGIAFDVRYQGRTLHVPCQVLGDSRNGVVVKMMTAYDK